jgi:hypothetical protein
MTPQHAELAAGRWQTFPLVEQLANVGSEVERALNWAAKGNASYSQKALERGLELLDLTIADPRHRRRLRELTRLREVLLDYFVGDNAYGSSESNWRGYFRPYAVAIALRKERATEGEASGRPDKAAGERARRPAC